MKIDGRITMLINRDISRIELKDAKSSVVFARIELTPEQLVRIMSREGEVGCTIDVRGLDKVGKTHEIRKVEFYVPKGISSSDVDELEQIAAKYIPNGWVSDGYYNSQDSFFNKDGKTYARVTIRRWV